MTDAYGEFPLVALDRDVVAIAFAYNSRAAALIPTPDLQAKSIIRIPCLVEQVVSLEASGHNRLEGEFRFRVASSDTFTYSNTWAGSDAITDFSFTRHAIASMDCNRHEVFAILEGTLSVQQSTRTLVLPLSRYSLVLQECPFGWWAKNVDFVAGEQAVTVNPVKLSIHRLDLFDASGNMWPAPAEVRIGLKQWEAGAMRNRSEVRLPMRKQDGYVEFTVPPPYDHQLCTVIAYMGEMGRMESESYTTLPSRVVIQGVPQRK